NSLKRLKKCPNHGPFEVLHASSKEIEDVFFEIADTTCQHGFLEAPNDVKVSCVFRVSKTGDGPLMHMLNKAEKSKSWIHQVFRLCEDFEPDCSLREVRWKLATETLAQHLDFYHK